MNQATLDQRRIEFLDALYLNSGRTCSTYTGLWQQFSRELAVNLRDGDEQAILADCIAAIGGTESHLAEKHALACIAVIRSHLLKGWE